ncbi:MAG: hypothetical protein WCV86_02520 [Patescibacteria group bacterium]|jgi:hypothetical protein
MIEPNNKKDFIEETLKKITERKIAMRSKSYFVLRAAAFIGVALLIAAITLFLASLFLYYLRVSGASSLLRIGPEGFSDFLRALPLWLLAIGLFGLGIVLFLSLHFRLTFKKPLALTLGGVLIGMVAGSFALSYIPLHGSIFNAAKEGRAPFATPLHRMLVNREIPHAMVGEVLEIREKDMTLLTIAEQVEVGFEDETVFLPERPFAGDTVIIHGEIEGSSIIADAVVKVDHAIGEFRGPFFRRDMRSERMLPPPAY